MKLRPRKGDLVEYKGYASMLDRTLVKLKGLITATSRDWSMIHGHVSIDGSIVPIKNIIKIIRREDVKDYWRWL